MLKLKLQYFGHLMGRTDSLEKTLMLGKIEGRGEGDDRGWDGWMALSTQWTWVWVSSRSWWWTGRPGVVQSMGLQRVRHYWVTELNRTGLIPVLFCLSSAPPSFPLLLLSFPSSSKSTPYLKVVLPPWSELQSLCLFSTLCFWNYPSSERHCQWMYKAGFINHLQKDSYISNYWAEMSSLITLGKPAKSILGKPFG